MALENLTTEQFESLKSRETVDAIKHFNKRVQVEGFPKEYCEYWSFLKAALFAAKVFTPDDVDKIIDAIIAAGNNACPATNGGRT